MSGWQTRDPSHVGLGPEQGYDTDNPTPTYNPSTGLFEPGAGGGVGTGVGRFVLVPLQATEGAAAASVYLNNGRSAAFDRTTNTVYLAYSGEGRDLYVIAYRLDTDTTEGPVKVGDNPIPANAPSDPSTSNIHGSPAILLTDDGHINILWGSHNSPHQFARSTNPHDITAWAQSNLPGDGTYPHPVVDPDTGTIYVIDRAGDGHGSTFPAHEFGSLYTSANNGTSWSRQAIVDLTGHPASLTDFYLMSADWSDGGIHVTWRISYGTSHNDNRANVYHGRYTPGVGWESMSGTSLGAILTWADHPSVLVQAVEPTYLVQHAVVDQTPYVGWIAEAPATAYVSRWTGSAWETTNLGATGSQWVHPVPFEWAGGVYFSVGVDNDLHLYALSEGAWVPVGVSGSVEGGFWWRQEAVAGGGPAVPLIAMRSGGDLAAGSGDLMGLDLLLSPSRPAFNFPPEPDPSPQPVSPVPLLVVLSDFGSGPEPVTDADGLWLYGRYDIELEH